jgi:thiol-disulfide isomerase/thioredoxin
MSKLRNLVTGLASLVAIAGCSGGGNDFGAQAMPDLATPPPPPDLGPPPRGPYPAGPYGINVGDTLFPIAAPGYPLSVMQTDPNQLQWTQSIKIADIHANPKCTCLLLTESAEWCGPCQMEQPAIIQYVTQHPELCVYGVLIDGQTPGIRATMSDVFDWTNTFNEDFPVVAANIQTYAYLPRPDSLPTNVVVNPVTMKILDINAGINPSDIASEFQTAQQLCASSM